MSIKSTLEFFKIAKPSPTNKDFFLQTAYNFEEWSEVVEAMGKGKDSQLFRTLESSKQQLLEDVGYNAEDSITKAYSHVDRKLLADGIADSIVTLIGMAYMANIDIEGVFKEVAASNLSKFYYVGEGDVSEEHILELESICREIIAQGRYKGVWWERLGSYVVFKDEHDKILKNTRSYFEPQLEQFI